MTTLANSNIIGFIPSSNLSQSKLFYYDKLDLKLFSSDDIALEFNLCHGKLRITHIVVNFIVPTYTVFGWQVPDIEHSVSELIAVGIGFELFEGFTQSALGVCTFPGGGKVAWFKDPDGNTLSLTEIPK